MTDIPCWPALEECYVPVELQLKKESWFIHKFKTIFSFSFSYSRVFLLQNLNASTERSGCQAMHQSRGEFLRHKPHQRMRFKHFLPNLALTASSVRRILNLQAQSSIFNLCSIFKLQRPIVSCLISPPIKLSPTLQELRSSQETSIQEEVCHQKYKLLMVSCILFYSCSQHFWMSLLMMHIGSELMSSSCAAGWWVWTGEERHHGMRILRRIHLLSY